MLPLRRQTLPGSPSWPLRCHREQSLTLAAPTQTQKILSTDRKSAVSQPVSKLHTQKEKKSPEMHLVFIRTIFAVGAFPSQGSSRFKELCDMRKSPRSCQGKAEHGAHAWLWEQLSLCAHQPPAWGIGFAGVEALCKLCGSRGKHTQLLPPWGKVFLGPGGGKPAASGGGRKNHITPEALPRSTVP